MGRYIQCSIAREIRIKKEYDWKEVFGRVYQNVGEELYEIEVSEKDVLLILRKEIIEEYLVDFLEEQALRCDNYRKNEMLKTIEKWKGKTYEQIMQGIETMEDDYIQINSYWQDASYLDPKGSGDIDVESRIIYLVEGKADLEEYNGLFTYLRNSIIASSKNPIRKAVVLTVG